MIINKYKSDLDVFFSEKKFKKIFLITGKNSFNKSGANKIFNKYLENRETITYFKKNYIPEFSELKEIIKIRKKFNPDLILAIGGGTVLDYAKAANCLDVNLKTSDIKKNDLKFHKKTVLCAIPTTAGSGAEVTPTAVIYINGLKYSIEHEKIKPDYFFLLPELIIDSKKSLKAASGFDAISQGIESLISLKSNKESILYSKKSLKYSFKSFQNFIKKPNLNNTFEMALAANLSGKAIAISRTTAPHALSYPFTSLFNVSHGHAVSLTLNEFLKFNYKNISYADKNIDLKSRFKILFELSGTSSIDDFTSYLSRLKKVGKLEGSLRKLKINLNDCYSKVIGGVNPSRLKNNPVKIEKKDIKTILNTIN
jgi:alcohol dehydrogenase class IV